jgi:Ser/Thr protein kinase RdoA (MazF antagonist)
VDLRNAAAEHFKPAGRVIDILPHGNGHVHDTFLVTLDGLGENKFILQRLNTRVFRQPHLVMQNIRIFTDYVGSRLQHIPVASGRRWEVPHLLLTKEGLDLWIDPEGSFWRAISFIDQAQSFDTIQDRDHAHEVGWALAMFHRLLCDLPIEKLADTLIGFHITPRYLEHFDQVLAQNSQCRSQEVEYGLRFVKELRAWANVLEEAKAQGRLRLRPIHGDPKVNNVMIDKTTRQAIGLVDLDTVKPGLIHYDIGDCLRSGCNPLGEDTEHWERVRFEPDYCRAILQGYLPIANDFFQENDYDYLFEAIRLIAFELGVRFLTDFLEGNVYFKVDRERQNLFRALVQFKLTESIESQAPAIQAIIREMR